jgi:hypothetical protein
MIVGLPRMWLAVKARSDGDLASKVEVWPIESEVFGIGMTEANRTEKRGMRWSKPQYFRDP